MSTGDLIAFAVRALRGHRFRTALTLLGVAIGVAAVILLTALGDGARRYVMVQFEGLGSNLLAVIPGKAETTGAFPFAGGTTKDLTLADAEAVVRRVPGIERIAPMTMATDTVTAGDRRRQVAIIGSTSEFLTVRRLALGHGTFLPPGDLRRGVAVAVLGAAVARELFPGRDAVGQVIRIGDVRARVVGVMAPTGTQLGLDLDETVVMPVARAMRLFNRRSLFRLLIDVRAHADLEATKRAVVAVLADRHREDDVTILTQDAMLASFSRILQTLTLAVAAIAAVSLAVAGLGIMNVMLVSVSERTAEVGLLRAVGVERGQITRVFVAEAALLSLLGGVAGVVLGGIGVWALVTAYPAFPARPPLWAVAGSLGLAVLVGVGFGLWPAWRAARLDPVGALGRR